MLRHNEKEIKHNARMGKTALRLLACLAMAFPLLLGFAMPAKAATEGTSYRKVSTIDLAALDGKKFVMVANIDDRTATNASGDPSIANTVLSAYGTNSSMVGTRAFSMDSTQITLTPSNGSTEVAAFEILLVKASGVTNDGNQGYYLYNPAQTALLSLKQVLSQAYTKTRPIILQLAIRRPRRRISLLGTPCPSWSSKPFPLL